MYFAALVIFAIVALIMAQYIMAGGFVVALILLAVYTAIYKKSTGTVALKRIENVLYAAESSGRGALSVIPIPTLAFSLSDGTLLWANDLFYEIVGEQEHFFEITITDLLPKFDYTWLIDGKSEATEPVKVGNSLYRIFGSVVRTDNYYAGGWGVIYWENVTELAELREEYIYSRFTIVIILLDNYDDLIKGLTDIEKASLLAGIDDQINGWTKITDGFLTRMDRDKRVCIFEERWVSTLVEGNFSLLESIKEIKTADGLYATASIGVGRGASNPLECFKFASLAIDMALSRGGDQAVIKDKMNFTFYGGKNQAVERNTKVKSRVMANVLSKLILDASDVMIMGHKFADFDVLGAASGLVAIARKLNRKASIVINFETNLAMPLVRRLMALPEYDGVFITDQDAMLKSGNRTLLIIVDTNRPEQVESESLLQSVTRTAVIDHHRRAADYILDVAFTFHEPYASSTSELVTDLFQFIAEPSELNKVEAEAIMAGIMLDTKNFTLKTGTRTFETAAFIRRAGADTMEADRLFRLDMSETAQKAKVVSNVKMYGDGFAVSEMTDPGDMVIAAQAADNMLKIVGVKASFVIFTLGEMSCISARSSSKINVQLIMEKLGGGGNSQAAGVQIRDKTRTELKNEVIAILESDY
jgi:c-di-AMP phosphodiesterase-like protein